MTGGAAYDAADDFVELLRSSWSLNHPILIKKTYDEKSVGLGDERTDTILINPKVEIVNYFSLYGTDHLHEVDLQIVIRSYEGYAHHNDVINEFQKIVKQNIRRDNYVDLLLRMSVADSEPLRNMFRHTFAVRYRKLNP
ncbi:MAG: hypothetical protein ACKO7N_05965 [Candidatus Nitrosotenuis sp.]